MGNKRRITNLQSISEIYLESLLYYGVFMVFVSMLQIIEFSKIVFIPPLSLILVANIFKSDEKKINFMLFITLFFSLGLFLLKFQYVKNGMLLTINQFADLVGEHKGFIFPKYNINLEVDYYKLSFTYFFMFLSCLLSLITVIIIKTRNILLFYFLVVPMLLMQLLLGTSPNILYNSLLLLVSLLILSYNFIDKGSGTLTVLSIITGIFLVIFISISKTHPIQQYSKNNSVVAVESFFEQRLENFRYGKNKTNSFTQGDFTELGDLNLLEEPAFEIIMSNPTSIYLRGFVGSLYTSSHWEQVDQSIYYRENDLFYWLNQYNFQPLNQLYDLSNMGKREIEEDNVTNITVRNISANSKYIYTPYELATNPIELSARRGYTDDNLISKSFFGARLYSYHSNLNLIKNYPDLKEEYHTLMEKSNDNPYIRSESYYREFTYNYYTEIPEDTKILLNSHLGDFDENEQMTYDDAIYIVTDYLDKNIEYSEEITALPDDIDFLQYFLEDSASGYSTHYATAGTLMFRYLGIPARYVEGYLITPEAIKELEGYQPLTIYGNDAHAWVEIYLSGIGWVPVEVTPPYFGVMEQPLLSPNESSYDHKGDNKTKGTLQISDDQKQPEVVENNEEESKKYMFMLVILLVILLVSFLIFILIILIRRIKIKKIKKGFEVSDKSEAIKNMYSYVMYLFKYEGLYVNGGSNYAIVDLLEQWHYKEYSKRFEDILAIAQEALYSDHILTQKQFNQVKFFLEETIKTISAKKSFSHRLKMKYWDNIC